MKRVVLCAALLATFALFAHIAAAQQTSFTVGSATARAGEKATGVLDVPAAADPALQVPVAVFRGAKPGPTLAIVAGSHGTEYASILALEKLISLPAADGIDPARLSGTVIVIPLINIPSFLEIVPHLNPIDHKNMNRFYPGKPDGTQSERTAYAITKQVVERSDYLIDMHGGDLDEDLRPYAYWVRTSNAKQDATSREMLLAFGLDHIIIDDSRPHDPAASRYLDNTAATRGKPSITVEAGHAGISEPREVDALSSGSLNVMRYLKMLPGAYAPTEHPVWLENVTNLDSPVAGIFYPLVARGSYVEAGMKVGYITDYVGKVIYEAKAPISGIVLHICPIPSMKPGQNIINLASVAKEPR